MDVPQKPVQWAAFQDASKVPDTHQADAYDWFLQGMDTFDIGKKTGLHESIICRWIQAERDRRRWEKTCS